MLNKHDKKIYTKLFFLFVLVLFILAFFYRWNNNQWQNIVVSDSKGYYTYLVNGFIDADITKLDTNSTYVNKGDKSYYNKFTYGIALLNVPFFLLAHGIAIFTNFEVDGYSLPYMILNSVGSICYLLIGLLFLVLLLKRLQFNNKSIVWSITSIVFATNLLIFSVCYGSSPHVYSFALISGFIFFLKKFFDEAKGRDFFLLTLIATLIILVRPFNGIIILISPIFLTKKNGIKWGIVFLKTNFRWILFSVFCSLLLIFIQIYIWYLQSEEFIIYGYSDEGFYFLKPEMLNLLFSFNGGVFIYCPILFLSLFGFFKIYQFSKLQFYTLVLFLVGLIYLLSSWWSWNYVCSFGIRALIDFYPLFVLPLVFLFSSKVKWKLYFFKALSITFIAVCLIQSYQFRKHIFHHFSMNFEKYKYIFLQTSDEYINCLGGNIDIPPYSKSERNTLYSNITSCNYSEFMCETTIENEYIFNSNKLMYVRIELEKMDLRENASTNAKIVIDYFNNQGSQLYYAFAINDIPSYSTNIWRKINYGVTIREPKKDESIKVYIWNPDKAQFNIKNFKVETLVSNNEC